MTDDRPRRLLNERTGKHLCIHCLKEVPADDYFRNDQVCDECAQTLEEPRQEPPRDE